jgi:hypothetical protein
MFLKNRLKDRKTLTQVGLVFLILGNAAHFFLRPTERFGQGLVDGVFGLLIGLSIGCLLLSLRRTEP